MAERLVNSFTVNRPVDEAWAVLTDVERIAPCLPGAQLQEIEGDVYRGIVKIKLGSIAPQFKGQAQFVQQDDDAHKAVLHAEGRDTGGRGNASADITAVAESLSPTSTKVEVTTDLHITGRVAQFGRGIIGDVSKKLMQQFSSNLNEMLDDHPASTAMATGAGGQGNDGDGDSAAGDASTVVASASSSTAGRSDATGPSSRDGTSSLSPYGTDGAPQVRKIDSPASEPVDLAGVAGPAVVKRVLPLVGALLVLLAVVRRRRR